MKSMNPEIFNDIESSLDNMYTNHSSGSSYMAIFYFNFFLNRNRRQNMSNILLQIEREIGRKHTGPGRKSENL